MCDCFGYVCHRVDRLSSGCCNTAVETTHRYVCDTCSVHGCCAIYEYCVSCCLHPDKPAFFLIVFFMLRVDLCQRVVIIFLNNITTPSQLVLNYVGFYAYCVDFAQHIDIGSSVLPIDD
ncbi:hypothetical protein SK128_028218 [Halocaridina rubra]|uniref:SREBP regulating gene protein n=1 Tax=Halocaridina rubra TaxID=373956 RepID=A0AAN8WPN6_HALRR